MKALLLPGAAGLLLALLLSSLLARAQDESNAGLAARGVQLSAAYEGEAVGNVSGGIKRGTIFHGNAQVQATFDLDRLLGWRDTAFFLNGMLTNGGQPGNLVGDAQGVSDITAPNGARLEEAWLQRNFDDGRLSVLAGRYDLNSEFYRLRSAALYFNSSLGTGPEFAQSGPAGASISPSTAPAARVSFKPTPALVLRGAVTAGKPFQSTGETATTAGGDGAFAIAEAAYLERPGTPEPRNRRLRSGRLSGLTPYDDKFAIGMWHYTATFLDLHETGPNGEPTRHHGSSGGYLLVDRLLTRSTTAGKPLAMGFLQLGLGDARVNRFGSYIGAGVNVTSFLQNRPHDEIGFAFASAQNGGHYLDQQALLGTPALRSETALELTYLTQISKSFSVQPDLQYVIHPNTDPARRNATVFLLRFEFSLD